MRSISSLKNPLSPWWILWILFSFRGFGQDGNQQKTVTTKDKNSNEEFTIYRNSYAIIIGIDTYLNSKFQRLECAVADAQSVKNLLVQKFNFPESNVKMLLNEGASLSRIRHAFGEINRIEENSRLLVYFAGHGETVQLNNGSDLGFLIPYDGQNSDEASLYSSCIPMTELSNWSTLVPAKHVLFLVDACYGGLAAVNSRSLSEGTKNYLAKITTANAKEIITAGGKGERVIERASWGHSVFTKVLLDGLGKALADLDGDGIISATELAAYTKKQVTIYSNNQQTPVFRSFTPDEGDFVFVVNKSSVEGNGLMNVSIMSDMEKAAVTLDGKEIGSALPLNLDLALGPHKILFENEAAKVVKEFVVEENSLNKFDFKCRASLTVTSNVHDAQIFLKGKPVGRTEPMELKDLYEGPYSVSLRKQNKTLEKSAMLVSEKANAVYFQFPVGHLIIKTDIRDPEIYVRGELAARSDSVTLDLLADTCSITVRGLGETRTYRVTIEESTTQTLRINFRPNKVWQYARMGTAAVGISVGAFFLLKPKNRPNQVGTPPSFPR
jgi:hypothetical protein